MTQARKCGLDDDLHEDKSEYLWKGPNNTKQGLQPPTPNTADNNYCFANFKYVEGYVNISYYFKYFKYAKG